MLTRMQPASRASAATRRVISAACAAAAPPHARRRRPPSACNRASAHPPPYGLPAAAIGQPLRFARVRHATSLRAPLAPRRARAEIATLSPPPSAPRARASARGLCHHARTLPPRKCRHAARAVNTNLADAPAPGGRVWRVRTRRTRMARCMAVGKPTLPTPLPSAAAAAESADAGKQEPSAAVPSNHGGEVLVGTSTTACMHACMHAHATRSSTGRPMMPHSLVITPITPV
eukprot:356907-Chlamydomonas_euryale.AAC.6